MPKWRCFCLPYPRQWIDVTCEGSVLLTTITVFIAKICDRPFDSNFTIKNVKIWNSFLKIWFCFKGFDTSRNVMMIFPIIVWRKVKKLSIIKLVVYTSGNNYGTTLSNESFFFQFILLLHFDNWRKMVSNHHIIPVFVVDFDLKMKRTLIR